MGASEPCPAGSSSPAALPSPAAPWRLQAEGRRSRCSSPQLGAALTAIHSELRRNGGLRSTIDQRVHEYHVTMVGSLRRPTHN
eukprot:4060439-Prymnesium_polylepis.1